MRFKKTLLSLVLATYLLATEQKVEIVAKTVDNQDNILTATGTAIAVGKGYYIKADKIIYDKNCDVIEAIGNVYAIKGSTSYIMSDYAKVYLDDKTGSFNRFFMQNQSDDIWISSQTASGSQGVYDVNNSITSSCSVDNPEWEIKYDKGVYDSEEKQVRLSNATFYAGRIPLFYSPYLSFSTDNTRRTGILKPEFGFKGDEGFILAQPIYYVTNPDSNWDSETTPQIRTTRGLGLFETLRFIDSPYSKGSFTMGYFRDNKTYDKTYDMRYSSHYGYSLLYDRRRVFADPLNGEQDGFYADVNYLNDIDYENLQNFNKYRIDQNIDSIAMSRINYFYQKNQNYVGAYMVYSLQTTKDPASTETMREINDKVIQELPKLQYHRYLDNAYYDNLLYSLDSKFTRFTRNTGLTADQYQLLAPVSLNFSFFDDYLGVSYTENLYTNRVNFAQTNGAAFNDYSYSSDIHKLKLYTSLLKPYENFIHTIDFEAIYSRPGFKNESNYRTSTDPTTNDLLSQVMSTSESENASFKLAQFFYDTKGNQIISHRMNQVVYMDTSRVDYKYDDLENEIIANLTDNVTLSTDVFYSYKNSNISSATTSLQYTDKDEGSISLSQTYKNINTFIEVDKANYLSLGFNKKINYKYYVFGNYDFDYHLNQERSWGIGAGMKKRCFNYQVSIKNETMPILTSSSNTSIKNLVVYLSVNFVPIGGINQVYSAR